MKNKQAPYLRILLLLILLVVLFAIGRYSLFYNDGLRDHSSGLNPTHNPYQLESQSIQLPLQPIVDVLEPPLVERKLIFQDHLAIQAELRLQSDVRYDGSYHKIGYPLGDVPAHIGVCTDVVIRSFRGLGIDLQKRVHEDMKSNFRSYPTKWKSTKPDTNIDHRRVPNLMTYFKRSGASLKITDNPFDYFAGNIVAWDISQGKGKGLVHIGIVSNYVSEVTGNPLIVHNIGAGPQMNDMLFDFKIIGHYKYGE